MRMVEHYRTGPDTSHVRDGNSHYIENRNTGERVYCDYASWQRGIDASLESNHARLAQQAFVPAHYYINHTDGSCECLATTLPQSPWEHPQPSPTYCRIVGLVLLLVTAVFSPFILLAWGAVSLADTLTGADVRDWGFMELFEDFGEMLSGRPPRDFQ